MKCGTVCRPRGLQLSPNSEEALGVVDDLTAVPRDGEVADADICLLTLQHAHQTGPAAGGIQTAPLAVH